MKEKKLFFERPTPAQIKEGKEPVLLENKIVAALQELQPQQYAVIPEKLFDTNLNDFAKFWKHGETFQLGNYRPFGKSPRDLFQEAVTNPQTSFNTYMGGYSFRPRLGLDKVPRRVPFVELLEAARILAYGNIYPDAAVTIHGEYIHAARTATEGGSFIVSTPSRTRKHDRYRFKISGIPVQFSKPFVYLIPYSFTSKELGVESKIFRELRFNKAESSESSQTYYVQAHEIAAAYTIAETQSKKGNTVPLRFLVFPTVSQSAVDLYTALLNRTLLQVQEDGKIHHKHLSQAHMEAVMWRLVRRQGYVKGFDDSALQEGRVYNYNWKSSIFFQF